jgi:hypothetical protein
MFLEILDINFFISQYFLYCRLIVSIYIYIWVNRDRASNLFPIIRDNGTEGKEMFMVGYGAR